MIPRRLKPGDTIGIVSPSHVAQKDWYAPFLEGMRQRGFNVREGANLYADSYGYAASIEERVDDFNAMIHDDEVKLVLFGGGEGSIELLKHIDYEAIKRSPKQFLSYSDGTSILGAIESMTGVETYYGQSVGLFDDMSAYDEAQFMARMVRGGVREHIKATPWRVLTPGRAVGTIKGGYLLNFALLLSSPFYSLENTQDIILVLEDNEEFGNVSHVASLLASIEQCSAMEKVRGLVFGSYSTPVNEHLLQMLTRFGQRRSIPVVYTDDFGHGATHAIFPIGASCVLDNDAQSLLYLR